MNPQHAIRKLFPTAHRLLVERSLRSLELPECDSVLIVGAGHDPYRKLFPRTKEYIRLDIQPIAGITDVVADATAMPFADGHFDCVLASEVMEHIADPFRFASEVKRVLKTGGTLVLTVPFLFHEHGDPHDYWRPTRGALHELFGDLDALRVMRLGNGFHVISDLITTAFTPYPILFPLRAINHLLSLFPAAVLDGRLSSKAPSGYLVVGTKRSQA